MNLKRLALAALLLTFMSTFNFAAVDRAVCSASDPGGISCTAAQLKTNINEEVNAVDTRAPMTLGSVSGTNDYTASVTPILTSLVAGQSFWFKPSVTNTSTARLNINSIGLIAIVSNAGVALSAGDLVSTNYYLLYYDGINFKQMTTPLAASGTGQIAFPGTQNPSSNANTLDDYEEGTWTPTITFGGSATGVIYSAQTGTYTKIGNLVTLFGHIILTNNGSGVGAAVITSLPFTIAGQTVGTGLLGAGGSAATGLKLFTVTSTTLNLYIPGAAADAAATDTNVTNTFDFYFTITYAV